MVVTCLSVQTSRSASIVDNVHPELNVTKRPVTTTALAATMMMMMMSSQPSSRWQDLQQRPLSGRIRMYCIIFFCGMLYIYLLLCSQAETTSHVAVSTRNLRAATDAFTRRYEQEHHLTREELAMLHPNENLFQAKGSDNSGGDDRSVTNDERTSSGSQRKSPSGLGLLLSTIRTIQNVAIMMIFVVLMRMLTNRPQQEQSMGTSLSTSRWTINPSRVARETTRRPTGQRTSAHRRRFQQWVTRLNRQRVAQGERPLSPDVLRLVLRDQDLTDGNDYDGLLQFQEQALGVLSHMGATDAEIDRCPTRVLQEGDDLLKALSGGTLPACAVCLETYQVGETVRTLPCFHAFHKQCIDPWLAQKAVCPICKHSSIT